MTETPRRFEAIETEAWGLDAYGAELRRMWRLGWTLIFTVTDGFVRRMMWARERTS